MAFLPAEALGLGDSDALKPDLMQGFFHLVQFERFDDGFDLFHLSIAFTTGGRCADFGPSAGADERPTAAISMRRANRQIVGKAVFLHNRAALTGELHFSTP